MYDLTGQIAEKRKLKGDETLADLVALFKEREAVFSTPVLNGVDAHIIKEIRKNQDIIGKQMASIIVDVSLPSEISYKEKSLNHLTIEHILADFESKYDELHPDLFKLKRNIEVSVQGNEYTVTIPLFAKNAFGADNVWGHEVKINKGYNSHTVDFKSNPPPITRKVRQKAKQARVDYLESYLRALKKPVVGDWLLKYNGPKDLDLQVYWIPKPSELNITVTTIDNDPLLVADAYNRKFLVATWNVEGEEPFEHYIREYKV
ncbi:hypothetical protein HYV89_01290 [Candidatus Woesearchaeota archaeon]|nr:hypothetical protein [Candidatus Woesearchaeota archaeon]